MVGSDALLANCTLSKNDAIFGGSSIDVQTSSSEPNATLTMDSCTVNRGTGDTSIGLSSVMGEGTPTLIAKNSILEEGPDGNVFGLGDGAVIVSQGFNFLGNNFEVPLDFPVGLPNANGDFVGSNSSPLEAGLNSLADNGGPTRTHAPDLGSLVVDNGSTTQLFDQRGRPRNASGIDGDCDGLNQVDIGAVEKTVYSVTNTLDSGSGSLREAITTNNAVPRDAVCVLASGTINLLSTLDAGLATPLRGGSRTPSEAAQGSLAVGSCRILSLKISNPLEHLQGSLVNLDGGHHSVTNEHIGHIFII